MSQNQQQEKVSLETVGMYYAKQLFGQTPPGTLMHGEGYRCYQTIVYGRLEDFMSRLRVFELDLTELESGVAFLEDRYPFLPNDPNSADDRMHSALTWGGNDHWHDNVSTHSAMNTQMLKHLGDLAMVNTLKDFRAFGDTAWANSSCIPGNFFQGEVHVGECWNTATVRAFSHHLAHPGALRTIMVLELLTETPTADNPNLQMHE